MPRHTTSTLCLLSLGRPFAAKFAGKCPLLGTRYAAGSAIRRGEFRCSKTGRTFTAYLPAAGDSRRFAGVTNTVSLMEYRSTGGDDVITNFVRATEDAAESAWDALQAGFTVTVITRTGVKTASQANIYTRKVYSKSSPKTRAAWLSNFRRFAAAYSVTGNDWATRERLSTSSRDLMAR